MPGPGENHFGLGKPAPPFPAEPVPVRAVGGSLPAKMRLPLPGRDHPPKDCGALPTRPGGLELPDQLIEPPGRRSGSGRDRRTRPGQDRTRPAGNPAGSPDRVAGSPGGFSDPLARFREPSVRMKPAHPSQPGFWAILLLLPSEAAQEMPGRPEPARSGAEEGMRGGGRTGVYRTPPAPADKKETRRDEQQDESQDPVMDPSRGPVGSADRCIGRSGRIRVHGARRGLRSRRTRRRPSLSSAARKRCG